MTTTDRTEVAVLGAGLQGTGVALELARRGYFVTLIEQDPIAVNRASLRNEGKIHLGLIYANDPSLATGILQLDGALRFRAIVSRWIAPAEEWLSLSTAFHYLVATDSVVGPDALAAHYAAIEAHCRERLESDPELDYLGERPTRLTRPLSPAEVARHFDKSRFQAGFATVERAIDTDRLAAALRRAIADSPRIRFLPSRRVRTIAEDVGGFQLDGDGVGGSWRIAARQVVNATWERRLALDAQVGIAPPDHLLHRLKYRVIARLPRELHGAPSATLVLGRYGDVVVRPDGTAYLSWYPAGLRGWSDAIEPPAEWEAACRGEVDAAFARSLAGDFLFELGARYRGIERCEIVLVDAGAIVAIGHSDVDDRSSGLHDRSRIGVTSRGGYHSVDGGKLTTAPRFAMVAADRVEAFPASATDVA